MQANWHSLKGKSQRQQFNETTGAINFDLL